MHAFFLIAAAAAQAAVPAPAADPDRWVEIGSNAERRAFVDRQGIRRDGDLLRVPGRIEFSSEDASGARFLVYVNEIDCPRRQWRILSYSTQAANGRIISSETTPADEPMEPIRAGANGEAIHEMFCR